MSTTIKIRPITEAEIKQHANTIRASFFHANDTNNRLMYPSGVTPELIEYMARKALRDFHEPNSNKHFLAAYATVPNAAGEPEETMIAAAMWKLEPAPSDPTPASTSAVASDPVANEPEDIPPSADPDVYRVFHGMMAQGQPKIMVQLTSDQYWHLILLASAPEYQRRGAGRALLQWGLDRADADGRLVFLDATISGRPLYERAGFSVKGEYVLDGSRWGSDRVGHTFPMVRGVGGKFVEGGELDA